ncbi:hypothetical protein ACH45E_29945, partial [Streptomyces sp. NPDC020299]
SARRVEAAMTVDAHHHVWDLSVRDQGWITGPAPSSPRRDFRVPGECLAPAGGHDCPRADAGLPVVWRLP